MHICTRRLNSDICKIRIDMDTMSIAKPTEYDSTLIAAAATLNQQRAEVSVGGVSRRFFNWFSGRKALLLNFII